MVFQIFSSTFLKNKFPKMETEFMYFCQWRFSFYFVVYRICSLSVWYLINTPRLFKLYLLLCSQCPFWFSVLPFLFGVCSALRWMPKCASDLEMNVQLWACRMLLLTCSWSAVATLCLECCEGSVDIKQLS